MKKTKVMFRQGDVLVISATGEPAKSCIEVPREGGRVILAHGEVTGHAHAFRDPGVCLLRQEGVTDRFLTVDGLALVEAYVEQWGGDGTTAPVARLEHEEHGKIEVPPGSYVVRRQLEWSDDQERRVED